MPLFMLISGYLFGVSAKKRKLPELLRKRIITLIIPMAFWGCLYNIIFEDISFFSFVKGVLNFWFLTAVLTCSIIVAFIDKLVTLTSVKILLYIMAVGLLGILPYRDSNIFMYPYFVIGYYFCKTYDLHKAQLNNKKILIICVFYLILLIFYRERDFINISGIILRGSKYGFWTQLLIDIYRYVIGLVGSLAMMILANVCYKKMIGKSKIFILLSNLGQISMQVYILQKFLLEKALGDIIKNNYYNIIGDNLTVNNVFSSCLISPLIAIVFSIVIYSLVKFIDKCKYIKWVFGKIS